MKKSLVALTATATLLTATPALADERAHPLPEGTPVPYDPGYTGYWMSHDVVRPGDQDYYSANNDAIRVLGRFDGDQILCAHYKGGMQGCYVEGQTVTDLGYGASGRVVTTDKTWSMFAPVLRVFINIEQNLFSVFRSAQLL